MKSDGVVTARTEIRVGRYVCRCQSGGRRTTPMPTRTHMGNFLKHWCKNLLSFIHQLALIAVIVQSTSSGLHRPSDHPGLMRQLPTASLVSHKRVPLNRPQDRTHLTKPLARLWQCPWHCEAVRHGCHRGDAVPGAIIGELYKSRFQRLAKRIVI